MTYQPAKGDKTYLGVDKRGLKIPRSVDIGFLLQANSTSDIEIQWIWKNQNIMELSFFTKI